jgi:hypothetical protein
MSLGFEARRERSVKQGRFDSITTALYWRVNVGVGIRIFFFDKNYIAVFTFSSDS